MIIKLAYKPLIGQLFALFARRIPSETYPVLLAAIASAFKHLLLSETEEEVEMVNKTWTTLCASVAKCDAETRRSAAETWSPVIRRLNNENRHECIQHVLSSNTDVADAVAWALVSSAKVGLSRECIYRSLTSRSRAWHKSS